MTSSSRAVPRYQSLANDLLHKIESGRYALGAQFPTEYDICAEHSVSRHTVRAALAQLHALGLIQRRPGAGTRVTAPTPPMRYQQDVNDIDDLLQYGNNTQLELHSSARIIPPDEIAQTLGVRAGSTVIRVFGLRYSEPTRDAICSVEIYFRPSRSLPVAALLRPADAVSTAFKLLDLRNMDHVDQTFDAASLPAAHAALLDMPADCAALRVFRVYYGADLRVLACATSLHPSGRFAYSMRLAKRTAP